MTWVNLNLIVLFTCTYQLTHEFLLTHINQFYHIQSFWIKLIGEILKERQFPLRLLLLFLLCDAIFGFQRVRELIKIISELLKVAMVQFFHFIDLRFVSCPVELNELEKTSWHLFEIILVITIWSLITEELYKLLNILLCFFDGFLNLVCFLELIKPLKAFQVLQSFHHLICVLRRINVHAKFVFLFNILGYFRNCIGNFFNQLSKSTSILSSKNWIKLWINLLTHVHSW